MRCNVGAALVSNSNHFALYSPESNDMPVILPPGRDKLATRPEPTGFPVMQTIGTVVVARCAARVIVVPGVTNTSIQSEQFGDERRDSLRISFGVTLFDHQVASDDISPI